VANVTEFLTSLFEEGLQYSTINGYRSAISSIHPQIEGYAVGKHPVITKIMAGVFNERPPVPKYTETWDVDCVLDYLKSLGPNDTLPMRTLTHKLTMLLALTAASRASELQSLNTKLMTNKTDSIQFTLDKPNKTTKPGKPLPKVTFYKYDKDASLDVVNCLETYLDKTKSWRINSDYNRLLLSTVSPHKPVATSTISNWLKTLLKTVGIDTSIYTGHSTRAASTSKAKQTGLSVADILDKANWTKATTFHRHYHKSVQKDKFSKAVLDIDDKL
jgi:hypothetical protein